MALKTSLMGSLRGEVLLRSERLEWIWGENEEHLLLEGGLPSALVVGMGRSLALRAHHPSVVAAFERGWLNSSRLIPIECKAGPRTRLHSSA